MAREVIMPQLGLSMDSGRIIRWLKQSGQRVQAGEVLLEVESDKAIIEVEAVDSGVLHSIKAPEDGDISIGVTIGYLLEEGEVPPTTPGSLSPTMPTFESYSERPAHPDSKGTSEASTWRCPDRPPSSPAARRRARELGLDWRLATGTGPNSRIKERDLLRLAAGREAVPAPLVAIATSSSLKMNISPIARNLAEAVGLDVEELARQHPGKRLEHKDVERAIRDALNLVRIVSARGQKEAPPEPRRVPMSNLRRIIAERMANSAHTTAPVTLVTEADATEIVKIREGLKADSSRIAAPSCNTILAKLVARALLEHPELNSSLVGDTIVYWETVNIGIAVDTERGLVVPVIRDVQSKSLWDLSEEMEDLLTKASQGKASPDELKGGTFTLTNLGMYEIDAFTPIINSLECAILGVGRLSQKMMVIKGEPAIRTVLPLSLTFDHRLVDGAPAARFLQKVKLLVEQPYRWWQAR
jgi:pyruvate dehydrogenase E2 component (dihydrolipoamide acetyltransferase)